MSLMFTAMRNHPSCHLGKLYSIWMANDMVRHLVNMSLHRQELRGVIAAAKCLSTCLCYPCRLKY